MKRLFAVCLGVGLLARVGSAVVIPVNCNLFFNGSNAVQIAWNCYPGESYVIQTTTNLAQAWQNAPTTPATLTTTNNALSYTFPVAGKAQFFKVVKLDTDGPQVYQTSPFNGAIGVGLQATLQAWLQDESGVDTNSIALTVGTNAPVSLKDPRLSYVSGVLTYTPATNQFLGTNGQTVTASLSVKDILGNQTTNFTWSFQMALAPVISSNIVFLGGTSPAPCNLTLLSTNGNSFTFSYTGSCCLTNGMQLVNTNLYTGYARTVVSFTNYPASNTVVALTRTATLAELLQAGTFSSSAFILLTNSAGGSVRPKDLTKAWDFPLNYTLSLGQMLYHDGNLLVQTLPSSQLSLNGTLHLVASFQGFRLTAVQAQVTGTESFELDVQAQAAASVNFAGSLALIPPIHQLYGGFIGPVPVWVDVEFEVNAGYTADFSASAEITDGINGVKTISVGRNWGATSGWADIYDNPPTSLNILTPTWQVQGSADVRVYLQPKVSVLVESLVGFSADLEPYLELSGSAQLNPPECDLSLLTGLQSTIGMDLTGWDASWGPLPSTTFNLIPQQMLWHYACANNTPPQITVQPQSQTASVGATVSFSAQAQGSATLSYFWYQNGLPLTDNTRITGSASSTLQIANVQSSDAANYTARVSNPAGSVTSAGAALTVWTGAGGSNPGGMVLIPAGSFTMGNCMDPNEAYTDELPLHTVYVSAFYMDKYDVTKALWDTVYNWAIAHGYTFDYAGSGKASTHPVQTIDWYDCVKWCNARSEKEGKTPAYYTSAAQTLVYRSGEVDVQTNWVKWSTGYRLPTEAEWEKAARGGASGQRFPWGNTISWSQANYYADPLSAGGYAYDVNQHKAIIRPSPLAPTPTRVRWVILRLTGMGCMTWQGMCGSGVGTGMGRRMREAVIPEDPHPARTVWIRGGGWLSYAFYCRTAHRGDGSRRTATTTSGSAPSCPQVSELSRQSGAVEASEGRAKPDCGAGAEAGSVGE
jgi:formylglycine-generating enzyme required for sulfatase activity